MKVQRDREQLIEYVKTLRYGPPNFRSPGKVFAKLKNIGKMLKISV